MISFRLKCYNDHEFDSWFRDSKAFDDLREAELISCPVCGICEVSKSIVAPNIIKNKTEKTPVVDPVLKVKEGLRILNDYVKTNFEDVGENFAEEARKISQGESEKRGIYGKANPKDAKELADEGIDVYVLPELSSDA